MLSPLRNRRFFRRLGTGASALFCLWAEWVHLPGLSLAGVGVDWPVIWVVCWSLERTMLQGAAAGLVLGLLLDGLTAPIPTHGPGLILVGVLTARLREYRFLQSETLAVALLTFGLTVVQETTLALQFMALGEIDPALLWAHHQKISLASGLVTCLWAPLVWWLLQRFWAWGEALED
ncbi:rod shape-determining protein MreD [Anthocerotibacter panamensis]|uniref:rod shape-determining protein MreD n=1 Tax=Anthocerotibacter panamensis TaxID=2857077 RepID=UPI001C407CAF|nr:rod shape-determining protein MreD [Anthocerotibacter panamensis]